MNKLDENCKTLIDYLKLGFQGFCIGIANIIPGVSGGTIALMFGIYEDLITSIKFIDAKFFRLICTFKFKEALEYIPWRFLGTLLSCILVAIFTLSTIMSWLMDNMPILVYAFFFGLILATVPIIARIIKWNVTCAVLGLLTAVGMYYLVNIIPLNTPNTWWFLFLSGAVAICTMILPGVSGSFVLVLLGKYQYIIDAVSQREIATLAIVGIGCVVGILTFVRVLSWFLNRYHDQTVAVLTGLVLGSLRKIWPWKQSIGGISVHEGATSGTVNVLPASFNNEVLFAIMLCIAGFVLAFLLSRDSTKRLVGE